MSTKQEIKTAEKYRKYLINEYMQYFLGLLHNAIEVDNLPKEVPKRYFLRVLFRNGQIGYANDLYLPASGVGIDIYGLPTEYILTGYNGVVFTKSANDCVILRLNDQAYPIVPYLKLKCELLADIDTSITQNLYAIRTQSVYEVSDQAALLSLQNAHKARALGAPVMFATNSTFGQNKLTVHETGADYLCDKLMEFRKEVKDEVFRRIGIMTANTDKRERVQSTEVNATVGEVIDNVYVMIDTFNHDAEIGGLSIRLKLNSVSEDYYALDSNAKEGNNNNIKDNKENNTNGNR